MASLAVEAWWMRPGGGVKEKPRRITASGLQKFKAHYSIEDSRRWLLLLQAMAADIRQRFAGDRLNRQCIRRVQL